MSVDRESGAEAYEFDRYDELIKSGLWTIETACAERHQIEDAPCFFYGGDVSRPF